MSETIERETTVGASAEDVFAWHTRAGAFERLVPPWEDVRVVDPGAGLAPGSRVTLTTRRGPIRLRWIAEHDDVAAGRGFRDTQVEGPFAAWNHEHRFEPAGEDDCRVVDRVTYELPYGALGRVAAGSVRSSLERLFAFRHARLRDDLARHAGGRPLRVAISGASGMLGTQLAAFLASGGHDVRRLVRREPGPAEIGWDPDTGQIDTAALEGLDAVVHLSGKRIDTRWTRARREEIRRSRIDTTRLLAETLATLDAPPSVLVSASAIGYYGARRDEPLTEDSPSGSGFLAELCRDWERAADPAREAGIRVVHTRTAPVLSLRGTPLSRLILPFRLGLGASIGDGRNVFSWVSSDDWIGAVLHALRDGRLSGPVNVAAPAPVAFRELADTLARVLGRPRFLRVPRVAVSAAMGTMGEETALASQTVVPQRLHDVGFAFFYPSLEAALHHELGR
jgi:uncharacterized protein (TIGR01777 family)